MRRTSLDVYVDILEAARGGANKTRIVYRANLNFEIVKKYLKLLMDSSLLEERDGRFYSTKKGIDFTVQYKDLVAPLNGFTVEARSL